ncbi:MAG: hypothetical protein LBB98_15550 [Treponema sp.]|jgi:hypothetical protein|nr:hypothetical protein [Treponema sp.]
MSKNYIPGADAAFDRWFSFMYQYVSQKCAGQQPAWTHIPPAALSKLGEVHAAWKDAYGATIGPHTPVETEAKNEAKKAAEGAARPFVNQYLRYPPVTNEDRTAMEIPIRDTTHTPVPRPDMQAEADVAYPGVHRIELTNIRTVGSGKDDSRSEFGVRIFWGILGPATEHDKFRISAPPLTGDDLPHSTFTHRKHYTFNFEGDSGKTVYFCLRYENSKGGEDGEGPFGPIFVAVIP